MTSYHINSLCRSLDSLLGTLRRSLPALVQPIRLLVRLASGGRLGKRIRLVALGLCPQDSLQEGFGAAS